MATATAKSAYPTRRTKRRSLRPVLNPAKAWFRLDVRPSKIHRWGIFAAEDIPARRRVIEYTGEKIRDEEIDERAKGRRHLYFFRISDRWAVDGAIDGSGAEFINQSCDPNLKSYVYNGRIFLSSLRAIEAGEELTYDYNVDKDQTAYTCKCGAKKCRGVIYL